MSVPISIDDAVRSLLDEQFRRVVREELRSAVQQLRMASLPPDKEFLSVKEAAEVADVSETTVRDWMAKGLRRYGQGRVVRVRRAELLAFLSANPESAEEEIDIEEHAVAILGKSRKG